MGDVGLGNLFFNSAGILTLETRNVKPEIRTERSELSEAKPGT
jgi:hypothetical protein